LTFSSEKVETCGSTFYACYFYRLFALINFAYFSFSIYLALSMKKIKWGIIGCGDVTEVKSGPAFNKVANSSLVAVMRRDAAKAEDYAKRHHVAKWYNDAQQLINDDEVNAIYLHRNATAST
jgi:hypothetical protein